MGIQCNRWRQLRAAGAVGAQAGWQLAHAAALTAAGVCSRPGTQLLLVMWQRCSWLVGRPHVLCDAGVAKEVPVVVVLVGQGDLTHAVTWQCVRESVCVGGGGAATAEAAAAAAGRRQVLQVTTSAARAPSPPCRAPSAVAPRAERSPLGVIGASGTDCGSPVLGAGWNAAMVPSRAACVLRSSRNI